MLLYPNIQIIRSSDVQSEKVMDRKSSILEVSSFLFLKNTKRPMSRATMAVGICE
jgi:hypothetical protein